VGDERVEVVVASFNAHAGVDGWGRPYDVVASVRSLGADVVVLQESWAPHGGPGLAERVGGQLGYDVVTKALGGGRLGAPNPAANDRWMRRFDWRGVGHALYLDSERPLPDRVAASERFSEAQPGQLELALLTRLPLRAREVVDLGHLPGDRVRRAALVVHLAAGGGELVVVGVHMAHLTNGSLRHFAALRRALPGLAGDRPAVVAGDMNLWGPPVAVSLPGWRRAVRGRSWPAWRPHSQVDHILIHGDVRCLGAEVLGPAGSDHRPVRARLSVGVPATAASR